MLRALERQRDRWLVWAAVLFCLGAVAYFALPNEPTAWQIGLLRAAALPFVPIWAWGRRRGWRSGALALLAAPALFLGGFLVADWRSDLRAAPRLAIHHAGWAAGRIIAIDRNAGGRLRLLLDDIRWDLPVPPPARIRITLHGPKPGRDPPPGKRADPSPSDPLERALEAGLLAPLIGGCLAGRFRLAPPPPPPEAGAFDFRFRAWFLQIGAVGHARSDEVTFIPADGENTPADGERAVCPPPSPEPAHRAPNTEVATAQDAATADLPGRSPRGGAAPRQTAHMGTGRRERPAAAPGRPSPGRVWMRLALAVERGRLRLADALRSRATGEAAGLLSALVTGERSGLSPDAAAAMRRSGLAHLLAISGLHMVLLSAIVLALVQGGVALLFGPRPMGLSPRRWGALASLLAVTAYLFVSGSGIPARRAWIMVTLMLGSAVLGGRVLSLRAVALAAFAVLLTAPESVREPGFQMSFAATLALILAFRHPLSRAPPRTGPVRRYLQALTVSSLVAGLATAPFIAWHFHRLAPWGVLANLVAVPVMGLVLMPALMLALLLMPLGLESGPLLVASAAGEVIIATAERAAALPAGAAQVKAGPGSALLLIVLAGLLLLLWRGRLRWLGGVSLAFGLLLWGASPRPQLLVAADGRFLGVMAAGGRALSSGAGRAYLARIWLERDGDAARQEEAAARPGIRRAGGTILFRGAGIEGVALPPSATREEAVAACRRHQVVIGGPRWLGATAPCLHFSRAFVRKGGGVALWRTGAHWHWRRPRHAGGWRPWSWPVDRPAGIAPRRFATTRKRGERK